MSHSYTEAQVALTNMYREIYENIAKGKQMKIEAGKKYLTRDGRKVTILTTDIDNKAYPVAGIIHNDVIENGDIVTTYTKDGALYYNAELNYYDLDIVAEYSEWNDVAVDTPVYVRDDENMQKDKGYENRSR